MSNSSLSSEMSLVWDKEERTVQAEFDWKRDISHPNRHEVELLIKHPSFEKVRPCSFYFKFITNIYHRILYKKYHFCSIQLEAIIRMLCLAYPVESMSEKFLISNLYERNFSNMFKWKYNLGNI